MRFKLCTTVCKQALLLFLSILWIVLVPLALIFLSPLHIYRKLVFCYARRYRKDLGKMVTARSSILAVDDVHGKPECNVAIWFVLKGDVTVKEFQTLFAEKVLQLRNTSDGSLAYPEFQQHYKHSLGFLFWKWDENFNISNHIKLCLEFKDRSPTEDDVRKYNEKLMSRPWEPNQSPWRFLIVPNYQRRKLDTAVDHEPRTLILFHLHHGMGDGYSFLKMILGHLNGGESVQKFAKPKLVLPKRGILTQCKNVLCLPVKVLYEFSKQAISFDINAWHLSPSVLTRKYRVAKTGEIPVSFIKEVKNMYNVSFTAVLFAAVTGGIRNHFLNERIPLPDSMHVFVPMPYPNHPDNKLRNHLTGCIVKLPVGKETPQSRLLSCHQSFEFIRHSALPVINFYMSIVGGSLPRFLKSFNANNHTTGILSNFPGNEEMIRIAGRDVEEFSYNVAPLHGRSGFTFTALTYGDNVTIDLVIDTALAPKESDAQSIVDNVRDEFNILWSHAAA